MKKKTSKKQAKNIEKRKRGRPRKKVTSEYLLKPDEFKKKYRETQRKLMDKKRSTERDIEGIPAVVDTERKESCRNDPKLFLKTYMENIFYTDFCEDHIELINLFKKMILNGEDIAIADFRGKGKSAILRGMAIWGIVYGHVRCCLIIGATQRHAKQHLQNIKSIFQKTELFLEDFPEICVPIVNLENSSRRADTQTINGKLTWIKWTQDFIRLPEIDESDASGSVIACFPITGAIRGFNVEGIRPDIVILDDIETRASVKSLEQTMDRERIIEEDVGGLGGRTESLRKGYIGTILDADCITDRYTDFIQNPSWNGKRFKFIKKMPNRMDLWERFIEIEQIEGRNESHKYYIENKSDMDSGSEIAWIDAYDKKRFSSALEYYFFEMSKPNGLRFCACELQNDPSMISEASGKRPPLTRKQIIDRSISYKQGIIPNGYTVLVAMCDVGQGSIHWGVGAFGNGFSGHLIDYGCEIIQSLELGGVEGSISTSLILLFQRLCENKYRTDSGNEIGISLFLVDSGWQTRTIYATVRASQYHNILRPSKGEGQEFFRIPPKVAIADRATECYIASTNENDAILAHFNTDFWKSFVEQRIRTPIGGKGSFTIFDGYHRDLADHCVSEKPYQKTTKNGITFEKWSDPTGPNHYWDVLIGLHVAASIRGVKLDAQRIELNESKKIYSDWFSKIRDQRMRRRS